MFADAATGAGARNLGEIDIIFARDTPDKWGAANFLAVRRRRCG
jgi:hypothetical protein